MSFASNMALPPQPPRITVMIAPVFNILNGMVSLASSDHGNPGVDDWIIRTEAGMTEEIRYKSRLAFWGIGQEAICNLAIGQDLADFQAFLDFISQMPPVPMRDAIVGSILNSTHRRTLLDGQELKPPLPNPLEVSEEAFINFLLTVDYKGIDTDLVHDLYHLLHTPDDLHSFLVEHLTLMWETYLKDEWTRIRPLIEQSVQALQYADVRGLPVMEALQVIIGRDLRTIFNEVELNTFDELRLFPNKHNGPYVSWFGNDSILYIGFGLRFPTGVQLTDSHNVELVNRLKALADETRLHILLGLRQHGELGTQQIMDIFDLNKSAASRHLRSLHASGLVKERRDSDNKSKFYSISRTGLEEIVRALNLLMHEPIGIEFPQ